MKKYLIILTALFLQVYVGLSQGSEYQVKKDSEAYYAELDDPEATVLKGVTVNGEAPEATKAEAGFEVQNIEVDEFMNVSTDLNGVIKTSPGVIIRETGGFGSNFNLSINGLSGKQIRYFVDDIPMENFGSALSLNNVPVNMVSGIEVYKGVTPIMLSADALGGAINIITPPSDEEFVDASYSYGSFNTHRAALLAQSSFNDKYYFRISSYLNHSDNNYWMDKIPEVDSYGNQIGTMRVKRFHDEYSSGMLSIKAGITDSEFADDLSVSATYAENRNNEQHPDTSINNVYGGYHTTNNTWLASIAYKKELDKLRLKAYILTGEITDTVYDTLSRDYDWNGQYTINSDSSQGELGTKSIFERKDNIFRANIYAAYQLDEASYAELSLATNFLDRSGNDSINEVNTSFSFPNSVDKSVLAGGYVIHSKNQKFHGSVFAKKYIYDARINAEQYLRNGILTNVETLVDQDATGYGLTAKYDLKKNIELKSSYESAFRFPEPDETLGSGKYIRPNSELQPEESQNLNIGIYHTLDLDEHHIYSGVNMFYRSADNFIRYVPEVIYGAYENLEKVRIGGIEISTSAIINKNYNLQFNATWQDLTDKTRVDSDGGMNTNYGNKVPNEPYLFANFKLGNNIYLGGSNWFTASWTANYVHQYFLKWEGSGNSGDKYFIPTQLTHDLDFEYSSGNGKYNIALSIRNVFDEEVYDNFDIQKPGQAFYIKFRYFN